MDNSCFVCNTDDGEVSLPCSKCNDCNEIAAFKHSSVNKYGFNRIKKKKLNKMLLIVIQMLCKEEIFKSWSGYFDVLKRKAEKEVYAVSLEFLCDCKQIQHQWNITNKSPPNLVQNVQEQLDDLEQCVYCFSRYYEGVPWVKAVCIQPHLLVWAKIDKVIITTDFCCSKFIRHFLLSTIIGQQRFFRLEKQSTNLFTSHFLVGIKKPL